MSQRINRAFYSEPLFSFPGRLHITAEKIWVEVLVKEDGKRKLRSFTAQEFEDSVKILVEQDFYQDGSEAAYINELNGIKTRAEQIRQFLFYDIHQCQSNQAKFEAINIQNSKIEKKENDKEPHNKVNQSGISEPIEIVYMDNNSDDVDNWAIYEQIVGHNSLLEDSDREPDNTKNERIQNNNSTNDWRQKSPAYQLVKERLKEDKSYDEILEEIEKLKEQDSVGYSSRMGKSITKATLSNWASEMGYATQPGNKSKVQAKEWRKNSIGYQWFSEQLSAGKSQEEIIQQFNQLHEISPEDYSTRMGGNMSISTFQRWCREILDNKDEY